MEIIRTKICHLAAKHKLNDMRVFEKECKGLASNGFDVTLIGFGDHEHSDVECGVKRIWLHSPIKNNLEILTKRNRLLLKKALEENAEVYHLHEPELFPIGLKLKKAGKKVIFDSHEFYGWQLKDNIHKIKIIHVPGWMMKIIGGIYMQYEKYVCKRLDAVVQVCTLHGKDYFKNRCKRTVFIKNMPEVQDYTSSATARDKKADTIAMIGGLTASRGITQLVQASAKAKARLVLAGNFFPVTYEKTLKSLPEFHAVDYRGFLDKKGMIDVLNECFIGASTILHVGQYDQIDTLPTKVYDYMAMEMPVILSDTDHAKEMNDKYHFGICVNPSDVDDIANAIQYLCGHPEEAIEMGKNGRKAILEAFNWKNEESKLVNLYRQLTQNQD